MIRKGLRPRFRFGLELPGGRYGLRRVLPFRRSWIAILALAAFDAIFIFPAVTTFRQAATEWTRFDSLFDLVAALFLSAWLLGWMIGPLLMTTVLLLMLFGREVLKARPGQVEIWLGLPGFGLATVYDASKMRNLRLETPPPKSGHSWRGDHAVFDYGANEMRFGSALDAADVTEFGRAIETAARASIRRGDARPEDVAGAWEAPALLARLVPSPGVPAAPAAPAPPASLTSASSIALILANLVPVAGAAFFGWALSDVMVLYWAESAIIGFFNLCKIAVIGRWSALLAGPFFLGHFGAFMAVHFLFIYGIFVEGMQNGGSGGDLREVAQLFYRLWPALLALFLSHAYSFFVNFIGRQEYRGRTVGGQMSEPYTRIIFMHLVLIFGGFLTMLLGSPTVVLIIVIALKIGFDLRAHQRQHFERVKKNTPGEAGN